MQCVLKFRVSVTFNATKFRSRFKVPSTLCLAAKSLCRPVNGEFIKYQGRHCGGNFPNVRPRQDEPPTAYSPMLSYFDVYIMFLTMANVVIEPD